LPQRPSSDEVVKVLLRRGFEFVQQRGSHAKLRNDGPPARIVIVPMGRRHLAIGTFRSICRQAGLGPADF
jgi:predicted RNA binding protein YcfA (HicA-like mRNA interferase family)